MSGFKVAFEGYTRYRGREGQWSFLLHRITGLGTLLFLTIHILDTATVYFYPSLYFEAIQIYRTTLFGIAEVFLVFCVFFHGVNGLRLAYFDLFAPRNWEISPERQSVWVTLGITLVLWVPAAVFMLRNLLFHNFGIGG